MTKIKTTLLAACLLLAGYSQQANADTIVQATGTVTVGGPFTVSPCTGNTPHPATCSPMFAPGETTRWITPEAGAWRGGALYAGSMSGQLIVTVMRKRDFYVWCGINGVPEFPIASGDKFAVQIYYQTGQPQPTQGMSDSVFVAFQTSQP